VIVADTNLIAYLLVPGQFTADAKAVYVKDPEWVAPLLWRSELRNVLWQYVRNGQVPLSDALTWMQEAEEIVIQQEYQMDSDPVLTLSVSSGKSPYDCEFVNLAQDLGVKLVTSDRKVIAAFPQIAVSPGVFIQ
jgi:predicted nucleic acid-binding protein